MKRIFILLATLILLTGCRPEQYTKIEPITGFIVLENGNVEFATLSDNGIGTTILELEQIYSYDGESKIIITSYDYYNVYAYLNKEDFEKLQEQRQGGKKDNYFGGDCGCDKCNWQGSDTELIY